MDLAVLTEAVTPITLAGEPFTVRLLKFREWGEFQAWLKAAVPSPVVEAVRALEQLKRNGEPLDPALRQATLDHAHQAARFWPPLVGTPAWFLALDSIDGATVRLLRLALKAGGHEVSDDEAMILIGKASAQEFAELAWICLNGEPPPPKLMTSPVSTTDST